MTRKKVSLLSIMLALALALMGIAFSMARVKAEESTPVIDGYTPYTENWGGAYGSILTNVDGKTAYEISVPASYGSRLGSSATVDLTTLEFDIFNIDKTYPTELTDWLYGLMFMFTTAPTGYTDPNADGTGPTQLMLMLNHNVAGDSHSYKFTLYPGWGDVAVTDNAGNPATVTLTDPANNKVTVKFSLSEDKSTFNVSFNEQTIVLKGSDFVGENRSFYKASDEQIKAVYPTIGAMGAGEEIVVTISEMRDSTTNAYINSNSYKNAYATLAEYETAFDGGIETAEDLEAVLTILNKFDYENLRTYTKKYINDQRAQYDEELNAAIEKFPEAAFGFKVQTMGDLVDAIDEKKLESATDLQKAVTTSKSAIEQYFEIMADVAENPDLEEKWGAQVTEIVANFNQKFSIVARAAVEYFQGQIDQITSAADLAEFKSAYDSFIDEVFIAGVEGLDDETEKTIKAIIAEINESYAAKVCVDGWGVGGNAMMQESENGLIFNGTRYGGLDENGKPERTDYTFYNESFLVSNFSIEFTMNEWPSGWFGISLMQNKDDVFSTSGFTGPTGIPQHKGIMLWLRSYSDDIILVDVFVFRDDSAELYSSRVVADLQFPKSEDNSYKFCIYSIEGSNNVTMTLNGTEILNGNKLPVSVLNLVYGASDNPLEHRGYLTILGCADNGKDAYRVEFKKVNGKDISSDDITTPDPDNVPAAPACDHEYDPETGYCIKCGEKDPNFVEPSDNNGGGCSGAIGITSGLLAGALMCGCIALLLKKHTQKKN